MSCVSDIYHSFCRVFVQPNQAAALQPIIAIDVAVVEGANKTSGLAILRTQG